jgi:hypothetical protein
LHNFKAYSTRALKNDCKIRARGGSTRALPTQAVDQVIRYVISQQGESMALHTPAVQIRQQTGKQADRRQESTELVDKIDAIAVG